MKSIKLIDDAVDDEFNSSNEYFSVINYYDS